MTNSTSSFKGNEIYSKNITGNACCGDEIAFERAVFEGSFRNPTFAGFEFIEAKIIKDSYGKASQQHTFTLQKSDGTTFRIKGRNLYKNGLWRKPWENETDRLSALNEKHERGDAARELKKMRQLEGLI